MFLYHQRCIVNDSEGKDSAPVDWEKITNELEAKGKKDQAYEDEKNFVKEALKIKLPPGYIRDNPEDPLWAQNPYTKNRVYFDLDKKQWINYDTGEPIPSEGGYVPPPHKYGPQLGGGHTAEKGFPRDRRMKGYRIFSSGNWMSSCFSWISSSNS